MNGKSAGEYDIDYYIIAHCLLASETGGHPHQAVELPYSPNVGLLQVSPDHFGSRHRQKGLVFID